MLDAVAVDQGLQCVVELYLQLPAEAMSWARNELRRIEQRVVAGKSPIVGIDRGAPGGDSTVVFHYVTRADGTIAITPTETAPHSVEPVVK